MNYKISYHSFEVFVIETTERREFKVKGFEDLFAWCSEQLDRYLGGPKLVEGEVGGGHASLS